MITIKTLFAEAIHCGYPGCREPLVFRDREVATVVAQIAHIRSESPNGPRYDPGYPEELLDGADNLLLICGKHHPTIDRNESAYPVSELEHWKAEQRAAAGRGIELADPEARSIASGDWIPVEIARFALVSLSAASLSMLFQAYCYGLMEVFDESPVTFTLAAQIESVEPDEGQPLFVLDVVSHHRRSLRTAAERSAALLNEMARSRASAAPEEEQREEALRAIQRYCAPTEGWTITIPTAFAARGWTPIMVSYEPELRRVEFDTVEPTRRNLRDYSSRLLDTSEAIEFYATITQGGFGFIESMDALEENPPALRAVTHMLDTHKIDFGRFRFQRHSPERWDFVYHEFDTELEERRLFGKRSDV